MKKQSSLTQFFQKAPAKPDSQVTPSRVVPKENGSSQKKNFESEPQKNYQQNSAEQLKTNNKKHNNMKNTPQFGTISIEKATPKEKTTQGGKRKQPEPFNYDDEDENFLNDDEEEEVKPQRYRLKKNKVKIDSDDDDEYKPNDAEDMEEEEDEEEEEDKEMDIESEDESEDDYVKKKKPQTKKQSTLGWGKEKSTTASSCKKSSIRAPPKKRGRGATSNNEKPKEENMFINPETNEQNKFSLDDFEESTPKWATKEFCKDKNGNSPEDPNYDLSTLLIPKGELQKFTPAMQQYWIIKSDNFDKVLFFKLGAFYEMFFEDAIIGNKYLELNWMGKKMHCGFPERNLAKSAAQLVGFGFKVGVIEQTETQEESKKRIAKERKEGKKPLNALNRAIIDIKTRGTFYSLQDTNPDPRYLISIRLGIRHEIGFSIFESTTNEITVGYIDDDENYTQFKTLICQIRPMEVVYDIENTTSIILKILKNSYLVPQFSVLSNKSSQWHPGQAYNKLEAQYGEDKAKWPGILQELYLGRADLSNTTSELQFQSLAGLYSYFERVLILEKLMPVSHYNAYQGNFSLQTNMILDSQALQHLEILETQGFSKNPEEGSLFAYINRTASPYGKRLLKRWLIAPLLKINQIQDRLDAIEDLNNINHERERFQTDIAKLPDIERICAKIYQYSIKLKQKAIYFEDVSKNRLKEFFNLLKNMKNAELIIQRFQNYTHTFSSKRLKLLVTQDNVMLKFSENEEEQQNNDQIYGLLPEVTKIITELEEMIVLQDGAYIPAKGFMEQYDEVNERIGVIELELKEYLTGIRKQFKDNTIEYSKLQNSKYQLEIPERHVKGNKKPEEFEYKSKRQGYERFMTPKLEEIVKRYEALEEEKKSVLADFTYFLFDHFHKNYQIWNKLVNILAEIDCLCSLSKVSFIADDVMCRPDIIEFDENIGAFLEFRSLRHPQLTMTGKQFVSNDVLLGNWQNQNYSDSHRNLMLLSGPNMGGKSTTLRMTCIGTILGQIGCYVPASASKFTPVDKIFTRIGGSDKLLEGKSTFYIEMEETLNICRTSSKCSLAILDELGRGTSTFDGVAIAYSVLKYLVESVKCRIMFATHYHILLEEFRLYPEIEFYHMAAQVLDKEEKIIFKYKLVEGECLSSFGINVAKVVGVPLKVISYAKQKSQEFEDKMNFQRLKQINSQFNNIINALNKNQSEFKNDHSVEDFNKIFSQLSLVLQQ